MALQTGTATFTGAEDTVAVHWTAMAGNYGVAHGVTPTDGSGGIVAWLTGSTSTGTTVNVSARFTGTVELLIWDKV